MQDVCIPMFHYCHSVCIVFLTLTTHWASLVAVHSEVRAEEQVSDSQKQGLGQWSSPIVIIQLICLERKDIFMSLDLEC